MTILRKSRATWLLAATMGVSYVGRMVMAEDRAASSQPATYELSQVLNSGKVTEMTVNGTGVTTVNGGQLTLTNGQGSSKIYFRYHPQTVKAAFLGLETSMADATLRAQLKLPEGVGLTVRHVYDQSPAQAVGVQEHDVLYKLNDQLLINPDQYSVLVRTFKPGDEVELTVIREAQPLKLKAKLIEKEVDALSGVLNNLTIDAIDGNGNAVNPPTPFPDSTLQLNNGTLTGTVNLVVPQGTDFTPATATPAPTPTPSK